jgi:hypothetical protein
MSLEQQLDRRNYGFFSTDVELDTNASVRGGFSGRADLENIEHSTHPPNCLCLDNKTKTREPNNSTCCRYYERRV